MNLAKNNFSWLPIITTFLVVICFKTTAQIIPSSSDLSYLLNPSSDIHLSHKVVSKTTSKWVILDVITNNGVLFDSLVFAYSFTENLEDPLDNFGVVSLKNYALYETETNKMYAFEPANNTNKYLILRVLHLTKNKSYTYIINLEKSANFFLSKTNLTIPILQGFSPEKTSIKIAKLDADEAVFGIKFYSKKFSAALPPMANIKNTSPFGESDTTYSISTGDTLFTNTKGLYSIFEQNNKKVVSLFRITSKRYPQLSSINEIIDASIYLFTKKEKNKLTTSIEPKKDYDAFWLENTNSSEKAAKMISAYFSRVKQANTLFSTFKEGWKTDMGMIYIIFGAPDKVFRSNGSVEWVYKKTYEMQSILFEFYIKDKNLDSEHFELNRNLKYQHTWFRAIDLWRKGRKNL